ncbi:hypothetical protein U1Q18_023634 [Sarracenia purpurea var. burkii]
MRLSTMGPCKNGLAQVSPTIVLMGHGWPKSCGFLLKYGRGWRKMDGPVLGYMGLGYKFGPMGGLDGPLYTGSIQNGLAQVSQLLFGRANAGPTPVDFYLRAVFGEKGWALS